MLDVWTASGYWASESRCKICHLNDLVNLFIVPERTEYTKLFLKLIRLCEFVVDLLLNLFRYCKSGCFDSFYPVEIVTA